jgi:hypothetical protein
LIQLPLVFGQASAQKKTYRGQVGGQHVQMELSREGDATIGRYSYDQFQRDLRLEGRLNSDRRLELKETDNKRHTGTFVCKRDDEREPPLFDLECDWTKPNGSGQVLALLMEQAIDLPKGLSIKPKVINQRAKSIYVSYPELISDGAHRVENFNLRLATLIRQAIGEFQPDAGDKNVSFDTNYYILLANDEIVSIEFTEYSYAGGAHPNDHWWTFNYDLRNGRELSFKDVFKSDPAFNEAVMNYAVKDINKLAIQLEEAEARQEKRPPKHEEPYMSADSLPEITSWGFTPTGVTVYFDFPHVAAIFTKVFIPYAEIKGYVKPGTPIARFIQ